MHGPQTRRRQDTRQNTRSSYVSIYIYICVYIYTYINMCSTRLCHHQPPVGARKHQSPRLFARCLAHIPHETRGLICAHSSLAVPPGGIIRCDLSQYIYIYIYIHICIYAYRVEPLPPSVFFRVNPNLDSKSNHLAAHGTFNPHIVTWRVEI